MYRDSFTEPGWMRFLRMLSASFRLGRFFRVEVRLYYLALIVMPLILLRTVEGLPFAQGATHIALTTLALFVVIWTHEMGHIWAGRRYGIETPLITLSPLGGVAHMSSGAPNPSSDMRIAFAGPLVHLLWLVPVVPLWLWLDRGDMQPEGWLYDPGYSLIVTLLWLNTALFVFNLLPFFPMDGGRILRAALSKRMHPNRATLIACRVGFFGGVAFIIGGIALWILSDELYGPILAMIGISNLLACKQEKLAALHGPGPYMEANPRQAWESDPDAWKQSGASQDREPGFFDKRRAEKEARRQAKREQTEAEMAAEVDRLLDRVNEVGIDGLSKKERETLMRASKKRRGE